MRIAECGFGKVIRRDATHRRRCMASRLFFIVAAIFIVVDIWKDTHANFPPVDADSITASAVPTISSGVKDEDVTLTGWTTQIDAGDWLYFNVDSVTSAKFCSVNLEVLKD